MNIFFDLDGTLIDSKNRLYSLFTHLTRIDISFEEYWHQKKDMISNEEIMRRYSFSQKNILNFQKEWMLRIESDEYLNYDKCFDYTKNTLDNLKKTNYTLFVITARQSKLQAVKQIQSLGLMHYFEDILVTERQKEKDELISLLKVSLHQDDIIVGDTGKDIQTGKTLNIKTVAVLSGFRNKEQLRKYAPDYIFENIYEFYTEMKL